MKTNEQIIEIMNDTQKIANSCGTSETANTVMLFGIMTVLEQIILRLPPPPAKKRNE